MHSKAMLNLDKTQSCPSHVRTAKGPEISNLGTHCNNSTNLTPGIGLDLPVFWVTLGPNTPIANHQDPSRLGNRFTLVHE